MISIILPVYNAEKYIGECLKSIAEQTYRAFEVLMVNDASTDNSLAICNHYQNIDLRFHLIDLKDQRGVCAARNIAVEQAKGEYLAVVDADDKISENYLQRLLKAIEDYDADVAVCDFFDESGKEHTWKNGCAEDEQIFNQFLSGFYCNRIMNKLYKSSIVKQIIFPEERPIKEDAFWTAHMFLLCKRVVIIPEGLYFYRKVEGSLSKKKNHPQKWIVGSLYNDFIKYSILYNHISNEFKPLYYKLFSEWLGEVLLSFYDLEIFSFYEELRLMVIGVNHDCEKKETRMIADNANCRKAQFLYLIYTLKDSRFTVKDKVLIIMRAMKRIIVYRKN